MADQMFFDARELFQSQVPYYEHDIVAGAEHKMIFAGLWRTRTDLRANATLSPVKTELTTPHARVSITMKANATVLSA